MDWDGWGDAIHCNKGNNEGPLALYLPPAQIKKKKRPLSLNSLCWEGQVEGIRWDELDDTCKPMNM